LREKETEARKNQSPGLSSAFDSQAEKYPSG
jgi:hypothetical protein